MTLIIELDAKVEAGLSALANARGLDLPDFVRELLEGQLPKPTSRMSAKERADAWRTSSVGLPAGPPLSDAAISREALYDERG